MRDRVARLFEFGDVRALLRHVGVVLHQVLQRARDGEQIGAGFFKQVVELRLRGEQRE